MKRTMRRLLACMLCALLLPVDGFAARANGRLPEPPRYVRELSRLVAATADDGDFAEIRMTLGEPEMEVDGQTRPIAQGEDSVPYLNENGDVLIPTVIFDDVPNGNGAASAALLAAYGYEVQTDLSRGTLTVTEPYGLCRLIVKTQSGRVRDSFGATHVIRVSDHKTVLQYADKAAAKRAAEAFLKEDDVLFCEPDSLAAAFSADETAEYTCWGTCVAGADSFAAALPDDLPQVTVAVVDSGADTDHPFLAGRLQSGWDFVNDDGDPDDDNGHGTHCAGIVRDATPENVKILPVKVLNGKGTGSTSVITEGIAYAADCGADVISLSLGGKDKNAYADAVRYALSRGTAVFAAAGNDGVSLDEFPLYPAACDGAITVAAVTASDTAAAYSDYGSCIDLASPGSDVVSSVPGGGFGTMSGTSAACPLAAACGALLKCEDTSRTPEDLRALLCARARDAHTPGRDDCTGSGIVYLGAQRPLQNMTCTQSSLTLEPPESAAIEVAFEPAHPSDCARTFHSSDPRVAAVSQTGCVSALSAGTAMITVSSAQGSFSAQISVTVTGSGNLRFNQIESLSPNAMRLLRPDGTAYAHGYAEGAFGVQSCSDRSLPFKLCGAAEEPIADVARFLTENFFVKTDGTLWLIGRLPTGDHTHNAPIPLMLDAQTPMTGVVDAREHILLRDDGTVWAVPKNAEPYPVQVRTQDGDPLTGIAGLGGALLSRTNGIPAFVADGRAYVLQTDGQTADVTALPVADVNGTPFTDVQDASLLQSGMLDQIVLHTDGTLTDKDDAVLLQNVQSFVSGCVRTSAINSCYALLEDGSVWDALLGCPLETADGSPLRDVVRLKSCQPNGYTVQFFAVCADGTAWGWGYNGVRQSGSQNDNAALLGSLGVGWDGEIPAFASQDGVCYAFKDAEHPAASVLRHDTAQQVMIDADTALTDVADVCVNGYTNYFIRSDGSVYCSGVRDYSGYGAIVLRAAVYAVPFTLLGQQAYLRIPGDADADGAVRLRDVTQIVRYLAGGWDAVIDISNADVDGDGAVTLKDAVRLRRYLAGGWDVMLI